MKKKILMGLMLFFVSLFVLVNNVSYGETLEKFPTGTVKITTDLKSNENTKLSDLNSITTRLAYIEDEANKKYFCLDADKWYPYGNYYSASEILKKPVTSWLLKNYYHNKNIISSQNAETQYAVTQLAIWAKTNPEKYNDSPVIKNNQIILDLMAEAETHVNDLSAEDIMENANLSLNPLSQTFKLSNDKLNYTAQLDQVPNKFLEMVNFTSEDSFVFTYNNQNITDHIKVNSNNFVKTISIDKQFFDSIYQKGVPLKINLTAVIKTSLFVGVAYYTENSSFQPLGSVDNLVMDKKIQASSEIILNKGDIRIKKVDTVTKQPLADATFALKDLEDNIIEAKTTDVNGDILFENLDFGDYVVEETKAPEGYTTTEKTFNVTINEATPDLTYNLTVGNDKKIEKLGSIKLNKLEDGTSKKLAGAEFALLDKDKKILDKKVTDTNGQINFDKLAFGQYYVQETKAPSGFILDTTLHSITINDKTPNLVAEINLNNKKEITRFGKIKVTKLEESNNSPLKGAEFTLYDQNKEIIETKVTNTKGEIDFDKLAFGQYYLKETKAPNGFILDSTLRSIIIDGQIPNLIFNITLKNKKEVTQLGKIKVIKLEDGSKKTLKDAEFTLFDHNKKKIDTQVTNDKGEIDFDKLPLGQYYLQETKAPKGFILDSTMHSVLIDKETPEFLVTLTLKNKREETTVGSIEIIKRDKDTGKVLQGAEFSLLNDKKEVLMTKVTDKNGKIIFSNLTFGKYFVKETKAPAGYELDSKLYEVELSQKTPNLKHVLTIDNKLKSNPTPKPKTPINTIKKGIQKQLPKTGEDIFYELYLSTLGCLVVYYAITFKKKF